MAGTLASGGDDDKKSEGKPGVTATEGSGTEADPDTEADPETAAGTRDNPLPIGSTITGENFDVTVNSVTLNATDEVMAANPFNTAPPAGSSYAVVNLTILYKGEDSSTPALVGITYVSSTGEVNEDFEISVAPEPNLSLLDELYTGASVTGNTVIVVPDGDSGTIRVRPDLFGDEFFVAIQ
jgi:hypothetical protein